MGNEQQAGGSSSIGGLFSIVTVLILVAMFFIYSGYQTGEATQTFWGIMIAAGAVVLRFVRKKDWKQHWEEQERMKQAFEEARRREKEKGE